jgi:hypothetical protein
MPYIIRSAIRSKEGDEFAPLSDGLKAELGISQRQALGMRAEAAKRREAQRQRALALMDAADRHAELAMLTGLRRIEIKRPPWWLLLIPVAAVAALIALLATAGWWL